MTRARDLADYISTGVSDTELDVLDGVTAGTVTASKALVVDANKDVASLRNITATGTITGNVTGDVTGNVTGNLTGNVTGNTSGTAATVTGAAQSNITSLGTLTTLTVDDITINGSTISDAAALTIDVGGDITLDSDSGVIDFDDDTLNFGRIENSSSNFKIESRVQDKDIVFAGNDGGSGINALTLDMSEAGAATFNGAVIANAGVTVDEITIDADTITATDDFTIDVASDIKLDANGGHINFFDDGTAILSFVNSSTDAVIQSRASDRDMIFKGNDGGSTITALTLDMSDAGAATFNAGITTGGALELSNNNITGINDIYLASEIYHTGDTDTKIAFGTDTVTILTGGTTRLLANNSGISLNNEPLLNVEDIYVNDKIFHNADSDTYIQFSTDTIQLYAGGSYAQFSSGMFLLNDGSLGEDYDALSGTTPTINVSNGGMFSLSMSGNTTFTFSGASSGYSQGFILQLTGNGGTVTYPNTVDWAGGTAPDAPANGETDILVFVTRDGGSNWYGALAIDAAA